MFELLRFAASPMSVFDVQRALLATDLLAGLAIDPIAQSMSPESAREIRRTTLQQTRTVIVLAIDTLG